MAHTAWHWMLDRMAALEYMQRREIRLAMLLIATAVTVYGVLWWINAARQTRATGPDSQATFAIGLISGKVNVVQFCYIG